MKTKKLLAANVHGYDISPDMVRLSLVNLYLHGFVDPHIFEYDTLSSEERWNEYADVILANPPFMSPKGGIKPHKRFSVQSKRSEVLFVDYIAEHLTSKGRAGIIVPEGIIFQSQNAYKELRKMLVEKFLLAVISLPAGVFQPYSGVKTSILLLDRQLAARSDSIAFFKVENDGFNLGAQRRAIDKNDLPAALIAINNYKLSIRNEEVGIKHENSPQWLVVPKVKIAVNGEYNLSGERYRDVISVSASFPFVELGDVCEISKGSSITREQAIEGNIPVIAGGQKPSCFHNKSNCSGETITVSASGAYAGFISYFDTPIFASDCSIIKFKNENVLTKFLFYILKTKQNDIYKLQIGMGQPHVYSKDLIKIQIPLPSLEIQQAIVTEIESYQKIIDGARMVVDNYRPRIDIKPEWEVVELGEICIDILSGGTPATTIESYWNGSIPWITSADIIDAKTISIRKYITQDGLVNSASNLIPKGNIIVVTRVGLGKVVMNTFDVCISQDSQGLILNTDKVIQEFLLYILAEKVLIFRSTSQGTTIQGITKSTLKSLQIPLPPLPTQQTIVTEIEAEQAIINANKELITRMENKITAVLARVWT